VPIKREVNKNFFKKWTPKMAYVLGFIFADGNIIYTKRNTWFLSIQITDLGILEGIKKAMTSSHFISKRKKIPNQKQLYRLQIGSKEICGDLLKLGVSENKSKNMLFPKIPKEYQMDFIRGYFDGDGNVWVGKRRDRKSSVIITSFTSGSLDFLMSLRELLKDFGLKGGSVAKKQRGFDLKYSIKDSLIFYEIVYNSSCSLFLQRKKDKFEKYIEKHTQW
jgi:intein-encoded DNA endonuclease-like protein